MAALALAFAACSSDDYEMTDQQPAQGEGIPFSATISVGNNAFTRALTESGNTLVATWAVGEKVALVHDNRKDEMTVSEVNDGVATIIGTITGSPSTGDSVTIFYPFTAAPITGNEVSTVLGRQDGTLGSIAEKYDVRKGTATLKVSGGTATLNGNVSLANQFAIFKFTVRLYDGTTPHQHEGARHHCRRLYVLRLFFSGQRRALCCPARR